MLDPDCAQNGAREVINGGKQDTEEKSAEAGFIEVDGAIFVILGSELLRAKCVECAGHSVQKSKNYEKSKRPGETNRSDAHIVAILACKDEIEKDER